MTKKKHTTERSRGAVAPAYPARAPRKNADFIGYQMITKAEWIRRLRAAPESNQPALGTALTKPEPMREEKRLRLGEHPDLMAEARGILRGVEPQRMIFIRHIDDENAMTGGREVAIDQSGDPA